MRKLKASDIFCAARVVTGSGLRAELANLINKITAGEMKLDVKNIGIIGIIDAVGVMTRPETEKAIYEVIAGPFEMTPEAVEALDLEEFASMCEELGKDPGLKSFFKRLSDMITAGSTT